MTVSVFWGGALVAVHIEAICITSVSVVRILRSVLFDFFVVFFVFFSSQVSLVLVPLAEGSPSEDDHGDLKDAGGQGEYQGRVVVAVKTILVGLRGTNEVSSVSSECGAFLPHDVLFVTDPGGGGGGGCRIDFSTIGFFSRNY